MAPKKDAAAGESGFQVFDKAGKDGQRVAINLQTGVAIETDGPGKYFINLPHGKHGVVSESSLEELAGLPEPEGDEKD